MHPIDLAVSWLFRFGPKSLRVFRDGWGLEAALEALDAAAMLGDPTPLEVAWGPTRSDRGMNIADGTFISPAPGLPAASRIASVRRVSPAAGGRRLVVIMAAWNDHGYATRTKLARLLAGRGIASVMLENPYYGTRRPVPDQPIRTVADFAVMGRAAVIEGRSLLAHFSADRQVGITGYSMGGNIAALIGAFADRPVAIAALAASHSPSPVWLDGVIRHAVDWGALGGNGAADRLRAELAKATVLAVPARPHTRSAVIVGATRDGYVPPGAVADLHDHWPGSDLRWVDAGHATMIWRHKALLVNAVVDAFDRLEGAQLRD